VAGLLALALYQKSRVLVSIGLLLGFLTMILSPLSLFSIVGTVLLLGAFVAVAVVMPWGELIFPAAIGGYVTYLFWYSNVLGRLPTQGGGQLEKEMLGLIALIVMWVFVAVGLVLRREEESDANPHADSMSLILATAGTSLLGFFALKDLTLVFTTPRLANAIWLLLLTGLTGGWSFIAQEYREKKDVVIAGAMMSIILLMSSIAYFLPEHSGGTAMAWAALGLLVVTLGISIKNSWLAAISSLPLIASVVRFIASDMQKPDVALGMTDFTLNLVIGFVVAVVVAGSAAFLRALDFSAIEDKRAMKLPSALLVAALMAFCAMVADEFSEAVPSVLWGLAGLATIAAGFTGRWKDARVIGLVVLAITVVRVFLHDLGDLDPLPRVISFGILGALFLLIGYGYNQNREKLQKYLEED